MWANTRCIDHIGNPSFLPASRMLPVSSISHQTSCMSSSLLPLLFDTHSCKFVETGLSRNSNSAIHVNARFITQGHITSLHGSGHSIVLEVNAVVFSPDLWKLAKSFWQYAGMGVSSRYVDRVLELIQEGNALSLQRPCSGLDLVWLLDKR